MIEDKKSGIFLKILYLYCVFELRFEIRSPKLPIRTYFSLIQSRDAMKTFHFLAVGTHQNDYYDVILSN